MFTKGQIIFGVLFFIAFVVAMIFSYKKDKNMHVLFYKGSYKVLLGFIVFIVFLFAIKVFLKH